MHFAKGDEFNNSYPLLYILLKFCLCCCSLATLAPQQLFSPIKAFGPSLKPLDYICFVRLIDCRIKVRFEDHDRYTLKTNIENSGNKNETRTRRLQIGRAHV